MVVGFGRGGEVQQFKSRRELAGVGFALVLAHITIGIATIFGLWIRDDTQRYERRRGRNTRRRARYRD
jgi:hypothetical protein